jgi:hypothetical protein
LGGLEEAEIFEEGRHGDLPLHFSFPSLEKPEFFP